MMRYVGWPCHIPGVPARDMTRAEWEALPPELREQARIFYVAIPDSVQSAPDAMLSGETNPALSQDS